MAKRCDTKITIRSWHERLEQVEQVGLGARVERRRRLVEDDDRRVAEQRPGDRQPLPLTDRDVGAAGERLAEAGVECRSAATAISSSSPA